jgi:hypothetical protein
MIERLYQEHPAEQTEWDNSGSFTQSTRSYDIGAVREAIAMLHYGTVPSINIRVNYLVEMPVSQIKDLWREHSKNLQRAGIIARVAIEHTKDAWRRYPVNRVHYHIAMTDYLVIRDRLTKQYIKTTAKKPEELMKLVKNEFLKVMSEDSIMVTHKPISQ